MLNARFLSLFSVAVIFSGGVFAQDAGGLPPQETNTPIFGTTGSVSGLSQDELPPEVKILQSIEREIKEKYKKQLYLRSQVPSVFFTPSQHALLREARIGFNTRVPTLQELKDQGDPNDPNYRPPPSLREISLGGILYSSQSDWVVYLNNIRITPQAIPSELVDIKVFKDYIEVRWFDALTNQIFPIRLRPNQRFNLDAKVFLPARES
ncbi:MAG TPA: hypothetical protein PKI93_04230 [Alphaproteobacteria bacterium]|nr:hypothetical protein [Alphaproteobacteria bacterium]HNS44316.1 hypothetical protein [Alphaproteobacteria bacterium]